jgi:hypothetical protein
MYIKSNATLTVLTKFLNEVTVKKTGEKFTTTDVQGYVRRGRLPKYLGGQNIVLADNKIEGIKLYNILE